MGPLRERFGVRDNYKRTFFLSLFAIFLLTGLAGSYIYVTVDDRIRADTEEQLVSSADGEADQLGNWRALTDQQLVSSARTSAVRSGDLYRIRDQLARVSDREAIAETHLVDLDSGAVLAETGGDYVVTDDDRLAPEATARLERVVGEGANEVRYSTPFRTDGSPPLVLAARKTESQDGRALVAVVDLTKLSERTFGAGHETTAGTVSVLNASGTVVLSSDRSAILTREPTWETAEYNGTGFGTYSAADADVAVGHASVEDSSWVVTNRVATAEAFALRSDVANRILLLLSLLLVGLTAFGATVGRSTVASIRRLADEAETLRTGDLDSPIETDRTDELGTVFESLDELRRSLDSKISEVEAEYERAESARTAAEDARTEADEARKEAERLNTHLRRKAEAFGTTMGRAASGDLTQRMDSESRSPAMTEIAEAFNAMMDELEATFAEIRAFADAVTVSSDEVSAGAGESRTASEQVAESIVEISADADAQSASLDEAAAEMERLSTNVQQVSALTEEAAAVSEETAEVGRRGRRSASTAMEEMAAIESKSEGTLEEIELLCSKVSEIHDILDLITGIAEQTNMLALNAAIEAARTDGAGDGFAVVADEIKDLADETAAATEDIEVRIDEIQDASEHAVTDIRGMNDRVSTGADTVEDALDALEAVADNVEEVNRHIQEINAATDDQTDSAAAVAGTIDEVAAAAEQVSDESDTVSAAAEEQTSSLADVTLNAQALRDDAETLRAELDAFTLNATERPPTLPASGPVSTDGGPSEFDDR